MFADPCDVTHQDGGRAGGTPDDVARAFAFFRQTLSPPAGFKLRAIDVEVDGERARASARVEGDGLPPDFSWIDGATVETGWIRDGGSWLVESASIRE